MMEFEALTARARRLAGERQLTEDVSAGGVAAALETERGNVYCGVCIDAPCGLGACAEHAAAAAMVTAGENRIVRLVAVAGNGEAVPPCGRCRELLVQLHHENFRCRVLLPGGEVTTLGELLPHRWS